MDTPHSRSSATRPTPRRSSPAPSRSPTNESTPRCNRVHLLARALERERGVRAVLDRSGTNTLELVAAVERSLTALASLDRARLPLRLDARPARTRRTRSGTRARRGRAPRARDERAHAGNSRPGGRAVRRVRDRARFAPARPRGARLAPRTPPERQGARSAHPRTATTRRATWSRSSERAATSWSDAPPR